MQVPHEPAYLKKEFLNSPDGRPLRILSEYLEPLRRFRRYNIQDTVVFFGSARILSEAGAQALIEQSAGAADDAVHRAQKAKEWSRYYEEARQLAFQLTKWTRTLKSPRHRFVVCSGGGPGIMEAANRGAQSAGGPTIGLNIHLPFEQGSNRWVTPGLDFRFHYFFMRKFWFAYLSKAIVVFPGGFGTLDEMFEILTLLQTKKLAKHIEVLLYGSEYWRRILDFEPLIEWGAVSRDDLSLFTVVDDVQTAFEHLQAKLSQKLVPAHAQENEAPGIAKTVDGSAEQSD